MQVNYRNTWELHIQLNLIVCHIKGERSRDKTFPPSQTSDAARGWQGVGKKSDFNTGKGWTEN